MRRRARPDPELKPLRWPLRLTRAGLVAEQALRAFWPLGSLALALLAALMLGLHEMLPVELVWGGAVAGALGLLLCLWRGVRRFRWPSRQDAIARLDDTMAGRPIRAMLDEQAIGAGDPASRALWQAHQARMAEAAAQARPPRPDLRIARRDPYGLRHMAVLVFAVALLFGSLWRVGTVTELAPGQADALAAGPTWEGWLEPPRYTGLPTIYLADAPGGTLTAPEGSRVILRFYGEVGALTLSETVSGRAGEVPPASSPEQDFTIAQSGELRIDGPGGQGWQVEMVPDSPPRISAAGSPETGTLGRMSLPFTAADDYGVTGGEVRIELDLAAVDRRYGLAADPEPRDPVTVPLPLPVAGDRREFTETLIEDFSEHPWAHLPVIFAMSAQDAADQTGDAVPLTAALPARRFFDPLAAAVAEQRRDLLWARSNAGRVAQVLRAVSHRPEDVFRSETAYLRLRVILRRLETFTRYGLTTDRQTEIAQALWDLAILLEEGDLGDALERLRRAQERLSEAMKNGASDQEIAELMQELREATDDYLRQLSREARERGQQPGEQGDQMTGNEMQMSQDDLQRMMDRIQDLMEQGRMAEAQQALQELQQMMENMRVTQSGQGQSGQSQGRQAMEGLADTLRQQQGLSDQAFRDLQEQFDPGAQAGQNQGNEGRSGGLGRGQSHEGQGGRGGSDDPNRQGEGQGTGDEGDLADRQQALRETLRAQRENLPGAGTEQGDAARDALDRAGRAMDGAEEALRGDDYADAIDRQSEAMEALREGMRSLGEALAEMQQGQPGQGPEEGDMQGQNRDPLGRRAGARGSIGSDENMLQGEDVYRRARELLDEIRRRSGEGDRPTLELDYLKRLLERF